jgi:hypothetical protein
MVEEKVHEESKFTDERPPAAETGSPPYRETRRAERPRRGYRSLFWPLILIGVGLLWLLGNLGIVGAANLSVLAKLWPIALIGIGLDVLVGRRSALLGGLIGLATVGLLVALVIAGPMLGLASEGGATFLGLPFVIGQQELKHATFEEAVNGAENAHVEIDMASAPTTIEVLPAGSDTLFRADVDYLGEMIFDVSGGRSRDITLTSRYNGAIGINFPVEERWDVELNPDVPTDLRLDVGSGRVNADLTGMALTALDLSGGSGHMEIDLPAPDMRYDASVDIGSGGMVMSIPGGAQVDLDLNGGSGGVNMSIGSGADVTVNLDLGSGGTRIDVPSGAAVRLIVEDSGSGGLSVGGGLEQVDDAGDDERNTGTWETPGYDQADTHILITVDSMGSGHVSVD